MKPSPLHNFRVNADRRMHFMIHMGESSKVKGHHEWRCFLFHEGCFYGSIHKCPNGFRRPEPGGSICNVCWPEEAKAALEAVEVEEEEDNCPQCGASNYSGMSCGLCIEVRDSAAGKELEEMWEDALQSL